MDLTATVAATITASAVHSIKLNYLVFFSLKKRVILSKITRRKVKKTIRENQNFLKFHHFTNCKKLKLKFTAYFLRKFFTQISRGVEFIGFRVKLKN